MLAIEKATALSESRAPNVAPRWLRIPTALKYSGLSRSFLYERLGRGEIASHQIGRTRVIDRESLDAFISSSPTGGIKSAA